TKDCPAEYAHGASQGKSGTRPEENRDHQCPEMSLELSSNKAHGYEDEERQEIRLAEQIRALERQIEKEQDGSCRQQGENPDALGILNHIRNSNQHAKPAHPGATLRR